MHQRCVLSTHSAIPPEPDTHVRALFRALHRLIMHMCLGLVPGAMLCACGETFDTPLARMPFGVQVRVALPEYPFEKNPAFRIDQPLLDRIAQSFIDTGGSREEIPVFLFSYLPFEAFGSIGRGPPVQLEDIEGLLYLSGFFGGLWLKGALEPAASYGPESSGRGRLSDSGPMGLFSLITLLVKALNDTARHTDAPSLHAFLLGAVDSFIALYGYNAGYLQSILEHHPRETEPPEEYLVCPHFMDCRTPVQGFSLLEDILPVAENLLKPPDTRWQYMKEKVDHYGHSAYETGYGVWSRLLSTEGMAPEDYFQLLDLSAGFLVVCQALVLSDMDAWVHEDLGEGRISAALAAGMMAWSGGYVIGLASDYPQDHLPRIEIRGLRSPQYLKMSSRNLNPMFVCGNSRQLDAH